MARILPPPRNIPPLIKLGPGGRYVRLVRESDIDRPPVMLALVLAAGYGLVVGVLVMLAVWR